MSKYNLFLFLIIIAGTVLAIGVFIGWAVNWYEE